MIINIVVGGPKKLIPALKAYEIANTIWVGVDNGVLYLLEAGITPDRAFGDFDSVTKTELAEINKKVPHLDIYPAQKDETDMEIALNWAINENPTKIQLFGATGGRLDHMLANVQLLTRCLNNKLEIVMIDTLNMITMEAPGTHQLHINKQYPYISFLPFSEKVTDIHLDGFKYNLSGTDITWGSTLCVSNELVSEIGTYSFTSGILIVIRSRD